jgi:hypothetical protein
MDRNNKQQQFGRIELLLAEERGGWVVWLSGHRPPLETHRRANLFHLKKRTRHKEKDEY